MCTAEKIRLQTAPRFHRRSVEAQSPSRCDMSWRWQRKAIKTRDILSRAHRDCHIKTFFVIFCIHVKDSDDHFRAMIQVPDIFPKNRASVDPTTRDERMLLIIWKHTLTCIALWSKKDHFSAGADLRVNYTLLQR